MARSPSNTAASTSTSSPLISSDEVNLLVYAYLSESSYTHAAYALFNESRLKDYVDSGEGDSQPRIPQTSQLVRVLKKGLQYIMAEAKHRGEDLNANPPRLVNYVIPEVLPMPAIPKTLPVPPLSTLPQSRRTASANTSKATNAVNGNAVAGPSTLKRKDKQAGSGSGSNGAVNGNGSNAEQQQQQPAKKQRTNKSPTAAATASQHNTDDAMSVASNRSNDETSAAAAAAKKSRKGKGRAVDEQGDSEMAVAESTIGAARGAADSAAAEAAATSGSAPAVGAAAAATSDAEPASAKSTLAKAIASAASATSKALPLSFTKKDPPAARRSTSPIFATRKPSAARDATASAAKSRPRSTSPATMFRTNSGSNSSSKSATTPTLDASKTSSLLSAKEGKPSDLPKPEPTNVLKSNTAIALKGHTASVQPCAWNPNVADLLATGSGDSTARIWDVSSAKPGETAEPSHTCKHASGQRRSDVTAVAWNSEGSLLATGSEDGIGRIWTASGDLHLVLSMHQRTIFCLKWNKSGSMLVTGSMDHSVCLWDPVYGKVKQQWTSHSDSIMDLDWMTDDIFASCSMDKNIHVHQQGRSSAAYRFKGHTDEVNCIRFDPSRRLLASCSDDCTVRIWSLKAVKGILGLKDEVKKEAAEDGEIGGLGSSDGAHREDDDEPSFLILKGHDKEVHAVSWCPKTSAGGPKLLASASFDSTARLWDAATGSCLHIFNRHSDMVYSLAWQPNLGDFLATGSNDNKMCIYRIKQEQGQDKQYELCHEFDHTGAIYEISWHPSRNQLAVCGKADVVNVVNFELP